MKILNNEEGLTLIETVIALTLVVILTAAFAGAIVIGLRSETITDNIDYSSNMASSIFDYMNQNNNLELILNDISLDFKEGKYESEFINFINDTNDEVKKNLKRIYVDYNTNKKLNLSNESMIKIIKKDELLEEIYEIKLIIKFNSGKEKYEITTMIGVG